MSREMKTWYGHYFDVFDPDPDKLEITDIAHSLATMCRFNGHIRQFYSVAEHCVCMSHMVPEEYAMEALLHDAGEAYMGDIIFPVKAALDNMTGNLITRTEDKIVYLIMEKFMTEDQFSRVRHTDTLIYQKSPVIKMWDYKIVRHEWAWLGKGIEHEVDPKIWEVDLEIQETLNIMSPAELYLARYRELAMEV